MKKAFVNGKIFTSDRANLYVDSILLDDGFIVYAGSEAGLPLVEYEREDLEGKMVIPGFTDAHMHPVMLADFQDQIACLPPNVNSIEELISEIKKVEGSTAEGEWIKGWGYDEGKFAEKRSPNRYDLDKGSREFPVFITRSCEHIRCVNSKALKIAGIDRNTPDPPGGTIERDERGEPTGVLKENARDLVLPFMPKESREERILGILKLGELLASQGIVAISDMGNLHEGENYTLFKEAEERGFKQRVSLYYMWDYFVDDEDFVIEKELTDENLQIRKAGLKLIGDGSVSGKTAWLADPYLDGEEGMPVYSEESMEKAIAFARTTGCQISVHAMGGKAIDRTINRLYSEEPWQTGIAPNVRLEHVSEPSPEAFAKAAKCGFAFVSQPIFKYCEIETYIKNLGRERLKKMYPHRSMLKRGINLALSTDAPATSWAEPSNPFVNIKAAVTGKAWDETDTGQNERIDIESAVILYTVEGAVVSGFARQGKISEGYRGDFLVLSDDIFEIEPERIDEVKVERTYIGGLQVYSDRS